MKKITLFVLLVFMGLGAMAMDYPTRVVGTYTSSCGVTWNWVVHVSATTDYLTWDIDTSNHYDALKAKMEAACGTSTTLITNSVDPDLNDPSAAPDAGSNQGPISTLDDQP